MLTSSKRRGERQNLWIVAVFFFPLFFPPFGLIHSRLPLIGLALHTKSCPAFTGIHPELHVLNQDFELPLALLLFASVSSFHGLCKHVRMKTASWSRLSRQSRCPQGQLPRPWGGALRVMMIDTSGTSMQAAGTTGLPCGYRSDSI